MTATRAFARGEHRRRAVKKRRRRQTLIGLTAVVITALAVVAVAMDRLLRPGAFPIQELRLEGEFVHLDPNTVRAAVVDELGDNYFSLDLTRIESAVEALPWAYRATVRRSWPRGLTVRVEEQRPVARWGETDWLNEDARIIRLEHPVETDNLVSLHGPDGAAGELWDRYKQWQPILGEAGLKILSITVDDRFAWTLGLRPESGSGKPRVRVVLGVDEQDRRVLRLARSYRALSQQGGDLLSIDLRYPNGMAITRQDDMPQDQVALTEVADE